MIEIKNLNYKYGKEHILQDINMSKVEKGSTVGIIGPNGAGKSTLLKCMSKINKIADNCIFLEGRDINKIPFENLVKKISYLPQNTYSNAYLSVFESILMARKFSIKKNCDDIKAVSNIIEILGIGDLSHKYIAELSGGQAQIVSIAQALIRSPQILLLDEPTTALDLHHQMEILDLIKYCVKELSLIAFITIHDLSIASRYCDSLILINKGKHVLKGKPKDVLTKQSLAHTYRVNADILDVKNDNIFIYPLSAINNKDNKINLHKVF